MGRRTGTSSLHLHGLVLSSLLAGARAYAGGAASTACGAGVPGATYVSSGRSSHGTLVAGAGAFSLNFAGMSGGKYTAGQKYTVELKGGNFAGFLIAPARSRVRKRVCGARTGSPLVLPSIASCPRLSESEHCGALRATCGATSKHRRVSNTAD